MKLLELKGQVIELHLPFRPRCETCRYMGAGLTVFGRVKEIQGTRDGPAYIAVGQSVLPMDAQVERSEFSYEDYYVLRP